MLFAFAPLAAQAQAFKCKQADGIVSYQDQPCAGVGPAIVWPPPAESPSLATAPQTQSKSPRVSAAQTSLDAANADRSNVVDSQRQREEEEVKERNAETQAYNKMQCSNGARQQLGRLKEARPVFRRGNNGDRQSVKDEDRQAQISMAQSNVAPECN